MITLSCPSCGANVNFVSKSSIFAVCSFCQSTLVRQDMNLEAIGKMAELQDDLTPLQIGTKGKFKDEQFELIGRLKVGYRDGSWNEWLAAFPQEKLGWLAEAQGFYAICFPVECEVPSTHILKPGFRTQLGSAGAFEVEDVHDVHCLFSEGELPVKAAQGRESTSVDLTGGDDQMATIEVALDSTRVFVGGYQEFDDFQFQNLRRIDGW
jgi:hypothetical protein